MVEALDTRVRGQGAPFLGVCVGMQLMADAGEEMGTHPGLGWIPGTVRAIAPAPGIRVPHMGWNDVAPAAPHPLIEAGQGLFPPQLRLHRRASCLPPPTMAARSPRRSAATT